MMHHSIWLIICMIVRLVNLQYICGIHDMVDQEYDLVVGIELVKGAVVVEDDDADYRSVLLSCACGFVHGCAYGFFYRSFERLLRITHVAFVETGILVLVFLVEVSRIRLNIIALRIRFFEIH